MATSSSDDSYSAPTDFNVFSSLEELNSRSSIISEKCPLCIQFRRSFYCVDCIRQGDFIHSNNRYPERYVEKKLRLFKIKKERLKCSEGIKEIYERKIHSSLVKSDIYCLRENLACLRLAIDEHKESVKHTKDEITSLQEQICSYKSRTPLLTGKSKNMITQQNKVKNKTGKLDKSLLEEREKIRRVMKKHIEELVQYIFPISEIRSNKSETDSGAEDTVTALAEATRTTYVHGRWVYTDNVCDVQYQIVESFLPASGDYSDYSIWVSTTKDAVPAVELAHKNPAYAITAGLTYTTQLISVLSFYMDLHLPHEICYSDFCSHELSRDRFAQKVAKLNANVLHLCFHQGVNPDALHPRQTIRNLLHLLNSENSNLGRHGVYSIETSQLNSMEESLRSDLNISVSSEDEDEENDFIGEWEKVHSVSCEDTPIPSRGLSATTAIQSHTLFRHNTHPPHTHATASATGGLVSSAMGAVTSWWKAALGK